MIKVGNNFGRKQELCPLYRIELNTQKHLTQCTKIENKVNNNSSYQSTYQDMFGNNSKTRPRV